MVVRYMQGASAQCVNREGLPAVHVAMFNGHAEALKVLVDEGADVNVRCPTNGNTALHEAVLLGPSVLRIIDALLTYVLYTVRRPCTSVVVLEESPCPQGPIYKSLSLSLSSIHMFLNTTLPCTSTLLGIRNDF